LTMLYRSTDRLCRCGAAVENLAHSASFHSLENNAPSNPGIKQLGRRLISPYPCRRVSFLLGLAQEEGRLLALKARQTSAADSASARRSNVQPLQRQSEQTGGGG